MEATLFTLYISLIAGSLIIDAATALALSSIPQPAPACIGSVTVGAYGQVDGLITPPSPQQSQTQPPQFFCFRFSIDLSGIIQDMHVNMIANLLQFFCFRFGWSWKVMEQVALL